MFAAEDAARFLITLERRYVLHAVLANQPRRENILGRLRKRANV